MSALTRALPSALKELRVHFCQSGPSSAGLREFVHGNYAAIKAANPGLPILVREAQGTPARAFARFELGAEKRVELAGLSKAEVEQKLASLVQ